jgi:hypothetical protein
VVRHGHRAPGETIRPDIGKLGRSGKPGQRVTSDRTGQRATAASAGNSSTSASAAAPARPSAKSIPQIHPGETRNGAVPFPRAAVASYADLGVAVGRVTAGNGSGCKSRAFRDACAEPGPKRIRTEPDTPRTNGKAERFIRTSLGERACARTCRSSGHRAAELPARMHRCNRHRPHGGTKSRTPISRLALDQNNLSRLHS